MVPMYEARVEHLTQHETVTALCEVCRHVAEVPVANLLRKFPRFKRIAEIRLWCTRCGERDRVELDATKAQGNDRAPSWTTKISARRKASRESAR
jgi:C4-type Zn-finger protein